jgi:hypothetical protein
MICNLIRLIAFAQLLAFCSAQCDAAVIWTYDLTNLGTSRTLGNPFILAKTNLNDGLVSFTASLVVIGSATSGSSDIGYQQSAVDSGGLGVAGNTLNGSAGAESLRFGIQLSNIVGGTVLFNGFSIVEFNGFSTVDRGVLSLDNAFSTTGDNTALQAVLGDLDAVAVPSNPTAFSVFSNSGSQHFQVSAVAGSFTGTAAAVPEPSTFGTLVLLAFSAPLLRRFRRRANSVDSQSLVA